MWLESNPNMSDPDSVTFPTASFRSDPMNVAPPVSVGASHAAAAVTAPLLGYAALVSGPSLLPPSSVKLTSTLIFLPASLPVSL